MLVDNNYLIQQAKQYSINDLEDLLISLIATTCNYPQKFLNPNNRMNDLGIDSMIAANINLKVKQKLGLELSFEQIANNESINQVANYLYQKLQAYHTPIDNGQLLKHEAVNSGFVNNINDLHEGLYDITQLLKYKKINLQKGLFAKAQIEIPYFRPFSSPSTEIIEFEGQYLSNFASFNYLGYNNDERVNAAAQKAIFQYGTSSASSRLVSGEKCINQKLEAAIADLYNVEKALVFVSGYITNVTVIGHLMEERDLIIYDSLAHNSIITGCKLSKAHSLSFQHNDLDSLEKILNEHRAFYESVLIVIEGLYSMDGDTPPLAKFVALKKQYKCLIMVDEAHSIGVLGNNGLGLREHCHVSSSDVDVWMGTLSKSFASCGGYIAGCFELIEYLKYTVPGLIFSTGISPVLAAASYKAIELLKNEPYRVQQLHKNSNHFLYKAKECGFNTGLAEGFGIIPIIIGRSLDAVRLANYLFNQGVNVQAIIYPGVNESSARLRFFISSLHTEQQIEYAITSLEKEYFAN